MSLFLPHKCGPCATVIDLLPALLTYVYYHKVNLIDWVYLCIVNMSDWILIIIIMQQWSSDDSCLNQKYRKRGYQKVPKTSEGGTLILGGTRNFGGGNTFCPRGNDILTSNFKCFKLYLNTIFWGNIHFYLILSFLS